LAVFGLWKRTEDTKDEGVGDVYVPKQTNLATEQNPNDGQTLPFHKLSNGKKKLTMVKVWYQPPPYGPRTALNRPSYGNGGDAGPRWVAALSKMPRGRVITGFVASFCVLAYVPLSEFFPSVLLSKRVLV
jgi:hypothetical protein